MPLRLGTEMPTLDGATGWLNGEIDRERLLGSPTLIHFWAVSCYICKDNMPKLEEWKQTYGAQGLQLVAVHRPRQESDLDVAQVKATLEQYRVEEPCAVDNEHTIGDRFETGGSWPVYFLFDAEGKLRSRAAGDAGLGLIEGALKRLLAGSGKPAAAV